MSKVRFYTDEHIARAVIRGLRQRCMDVLTVPEADMMGAADTDHLGLALTEGACCLLKMLIFYGYTHLGSHMPGLCTRRYIVPSPDCMTSPALGEQYTVLAPAGG